MTFNYWNLISSSLSPRSTYVVIPFRQSGDIASRGQKHVLWGHCDPDLSSLKSNKLISWISEWFPQGVLKIVHLQGKTCALCHHSDLDLDLDHQILISSSLSPSEYVYQISRNRYWVHKNGTTQNIMPPASMKDALFFIVFFFLYPQWSKLDNLSFYDDWKFPVSLSCLEREGEGY